MPIKFEFNLILLTRNLSVFLTILKDIWLLMMFGLSIGVSGNHNVLKLCDISLYEFWVWLFATLPEWSARADISHDTHRSNGTQSSTSRTLCCCPKAWDLPSSSSCCPAQQAMTTDSGCLQHPALPLSLQQGLSVPEGATRKEKLLCDCTHNFSLHLHNDKFSLSTDVLGSGTVIYFFFCVWVFHAGSSTGVQQPHCSTFQNSAPKLHSFSTYCCKSDISNMGFGFGSRDSLSNMTWEKQDREGEQDVQF